jgi:hypothetical protein
VPADLVSQFVSGHPVFVGVLGGDGGSEFAVAGLPLGLGIQGVALDLDPTLRWLSPSAPVQVTVQ